ncbi:MAG: hypothetical protein ABF679_12545 [Lentilactobacillus diolivorans]|uniref:hypothetical protein n=1 Tax=Lentilactobacillus diolivorans TaxID=179838 RepID=UPI0039EA68E9
MKDLLTAINPSARKFYNDGIFDVTKVKLSHIKKQPAKAPINWETVYLLVPLETKQAKTLIVDKYLGLVTVKASPETLIKQELSDKKLLQVPRIVRTIANYLGISEYVPHVYRNLLLSPLKAARKNGHHPWLSLNQVATYELTDEADKLLLHFKGCETPVRIPASFNFYQQRCRDAIKVQRFEKKYFKQIKTALMKVGSDTMTQSELNRTNSKLERFITFYHEQIVITIMLGPNATKADIDKNRRFIAEQAKAIMQ